MSLCGVTAADAAAPARSLVATSTAWPLIAASAAASRMRLVADPDRADMGVARLAVAIHVVEQRGAGHGEIAAAACEFLECPAPLHRPGGKPDLDDDLVGGERGDERRDEKIGGV